MLDNKIMTQQVLSSRGCVVQTGWHLCSQDMTEMRNHIMWNCEYAARFWRGLEAQHNIASGSDPNLLEEWIATSLPMSKQQRIKWDVIWATGAWALWRERNRGFFSNKQKLVAHLVGDTSLEIERWLGNN